LLGAKAKQEGNTALPHIPVASTRNRKKYAAWLNGLKQQLETNATITEQKENELRNLNLGGDKAKKWTNKEIDKI
jgi:hypothetical protein